ncbi:MAG: HAD hydrolase-like protein [Candidatus Bipolaricaulaceae bacterium]
MHTALVLSGIADLAILKRSQIRPTYVARDLAALVRGEFLSVD